MSATADQIKSDLIPGGAPPREPAEPSGPEFNQPQDFHPVNDQLAASYAQQIPALGLLQRTMGMYSGIASGQRQVLSPDDVGANFRAYLASRRLPPESTIGGLASAVNDVVQPISTVGEFAGRQIARGGLVGQGLRAAGVPNAAANPLSLLPGSQQTHEDVAGTIGAFAAPAVADVATGGALTPAFAAQAATQSAAIGERYLKGELDGGEALKELAITAGPFAIPVALRGGLKGAEWAAHAAESPAGQRFIATLQSERGAVGKEPPEGSPPETGAGGEPPVPAGGELLPPSQADTTSAGVPSLAKKLSEMIATARKLGPEQAAMISEQKSARVEGAAAKLEEGGGLEAFHASKSFLAGEYDKPTFHPLALPPEDVNALVDYIGSSQAQYFDRLGALTAIEKMTLGVKPQENELAKLEMFLPETKIRQAFEQQAMTGEARGIGGAKQEFPSERGATQMHILESDPEYIAARNARDAARSDDVRARYQAEMDRLATQRESDAVSAQATRDANLPSAGMQTHLADAINESYVGAIAAGNSEQVVSKWTKLVQNITSPLALVKTIKTSFDIGWAGRNGWRMLPTNPREWFAMYGRQYKAFASEAAFEAMQAETKAYPWFERSQSMKEPLAFLERGTGDPEKSGEEFLSIAGQNRFVDLARRVLNPSERAYVGPGNLMRAKVMDGNIRRAVKALNRPVNDAEFQELIHNINNASLRGNTKWIGNANARTLASLLFSFKGLVSTPQFAIDGIRALTGAGMSAEVSPVVRRIIAERVAAYVAAGMSTLGLAAATGFGLNKAGVPSFVHVDMNHNSKTFGTISVGGFRWNYWGADQPLVRAVLAQAHWGESARQIPAEGLPVQNVSRLRLTKNFVGSKIAPGVPQWIFDEFANGGFDNNLQTNINTPKGFGIFAGMQVAPIVGTNPIQAYRDLGLAAVVPSALLEAQGASTSTYSTAPNAEQQSRADRSAMGYPDETTVFKANIAKFESNAALKDLNPSQYDSVAELKKAYLATQPDDPLAQAQAGKKFDNLGPVDLTSRQLSLQRVQFYREHPDQLVKDVEAKVQSITNNETLQRLYAAEKKKLAATP